MALGYYVEPFGTARTFDGRRYFEYDEYRVFFREGNEHRGIYRLAARMGQWVSWHRKILRAYSAHVTGSERLNGRYLQEQDSSFREHIIYGHRTLVGPLQRPLRYQLIYIYDREGGCTGYCFLQDLSQVMDILEELWAVGPNDSTDPVNTYVRHRKPTTP